MILKPNMVLPGLNCPNSRQRMKSPTQRLASCGAWFPSELPGIAFLSGGQSGELASARLNAMNARFNAPSAAAPWALTFSFARAIQQPALEIWAGEDANREAAQRALLHRARCNRAARQGRYTRLMEGQRLRRIPKRHDRSRDRASRVFFFSPWRNGLVALGPAHRQNRHSIGRAGRGASACASALDRSRIVFARADEPEAASPADLRTLRREPPDLTSTRILRNGTMATMRGAARRHLRRIGRDGTCFAMAVRTEKRPPHRGARGSVDCPSQGDGRRRRAVFARPIRCRCSARGGSDSRWSKVGISRSARRR